MKKITVIIAAYASHEFIHDAIESVLSQRLPSNYSLELIIGVDGCDETWNAVRKMNSTNLRVFKMEKNHGTYVTFNTMMKFASGELIARFDADDIMLENYLFKQITLLEKKSSIDITRTWSIYTDLKNQPIKTKLGDNTWTSIKGERKKGSDGQMLFRKNVWNQLGGFKDWVCGCDTDFLIRADFSGFELKEINEFLYLRRVHENSLTVRKETGVGSAVRNDCIAIMKKNLKTGMLKDECGIKPVIGNVIQHTVV